MTVQQLERGWTSLGTGNDFTLAFASEYAKEFGVATITATTLLYSIIRYVFLS